MAKDFGIPVVVLSQLNREVEHRQGGRPQLSDLRDSGAIEQDADMVAFIHRKMVPSADGDTDLSSAELIVAKHRNGPTAIIPLHFQGEFAMYREMVRETSSYA
jgi:replicative DNA helicase